MSTAARFWAHVNKTSTCWLWTGSRRGHGYGAMRIDRNRTDGAHRVSWEIHYGTIPDGMQVLHRCDVPLCVNPEHLFLGTRHDNMRDMTAKGRRKGPSGVTHHCAKLTDSDVVMIRAMVRAGFSRGELARRYGLAKNTVQKIANGNTWKHVSGGLSAEG